MKKKSIKNKNVFADGGLNMIQNFKAGNKQAGLGQAIGLASGAMDLGASMYGNLQTDTYNAQRFNAGSLDSLQAQSGSYIPEPAHTENVAGNAMSGALKGAQAGMAFGPWGAGIGAVIGGAGEAITTLIGNNKEEQAALAAKTQSLANMNNNAQNISNQMAKNKQAQYFSEGGGIHINPSNKGKFTAWANAHNMGVQEAASHVMANKEDYSPTIVKRANFAKNAAGWHAQGGELAFLRDTEAGAPIGFGSAAMNANDIMLLADGGAIPGQSNGVNVFNNGGTHEQNPNMGIPQGIGANGQPNLVEEGEVKYKDYIYSNRLTPDKAQLLNAGFSAKHAGKTYGKIADALQKESKERPNDPISQRGLADTMVKLKEMQEETKAIKQAKEQAKMAQQMGQQFAKGGNLFYGEGNSQLDFMALNDAYNYQNRAMVNGSDAVLNKHAFQDVTGVPVDKQVQGGIQPISTNNNPEAFNTKFLQVINPINNREALAKAEGIDLQNSKQQGFNFDESWLRYAPIAASGLQTLTDTLGLSNKEDYSLANAIANQQVKGTRLTDRMEYKPMDTRYLQNQIAGQQAATQQNIMNTAGGNRAAAMAGLIGADYAATNQAGQMALKAQEYNQAQKNQALQFNRSTNQFNAEQDKWEQSVNQERAIQAAQMRQQIGEQATAVRSANRNAFLQNITGLGQEAMYRNMITSNPALYYTVDSNGKIIYKNIDKLAAALGTTQANAKQVVNNYHNANNTQTT